MRDSGGVVLARHPLALGIVVALAASASRAEVCRPLGGSGAAPLSWAVAASWSCGHVPRAEDDVEVTGAGFAICPAGHTCLAHDVRTRGAGAGITVRGTLEISGCHDSPWESAYARADRAPCGAFDGARFAVQGELLSDSAIAGDVLARGVAAPERPDQLRLSLAAPLPTPAAPGDVLQIRSGPERNHVYQVAAYDGDAHPPTLALRLYDPQMSYRTDPQTRDALIDLRFLDGGDGAAEGMLVQVAAPTDPRFASDDLDRCVQICRAGDSSPLRCNDSTLLRERVSPAGWFLGLGSANPADPAAWPGRRLVAEVKDDVPAVIEGTLGSWDILCFAEPLPAELFAGRTQVTSLPAALWPGFQPGDEWRLFRPARVVYTGGEQEPGDGMLGFFSACVDTDYAWFEDFARVYAQTGTPECQRPFQDTVFLSWEEGRAGMLTNTASAGGCNGEQPDIVGYAALAGDRVAVIDTRSPTDTSASCDVNGAEPGGLVDGDPHGSTHGASINGTRFDPEDPPKDWFFRYLGDDGALLSNLAWPDTTYVLEGWTFWYNRRAESTNVMDVSVYPGAQNLTVLLRNARVTNWASVGDDWCNPAIDVYPSELGGSVVPESVAVQLEDVLWIDTHRQGMIHDAPSARSALTNVLALGRDTGATESACAVMEAGSFHTSWIDGWSYLMRSGGDVERTRFRARGARPPLGIVGAGRMPGVPVLVENNVLLDLRAQDLGLARVEGGPVVARQNTLRWRADDPASMAIGNYYSPLSAPLADVSGNLVEGALLLGCSNASWAAANGDAIGVNLLLQSAPGVVVANEGNCPAAASRQIVRTPAQTELAADGFEADFDDRHFGPVLPVGVPPESPIYALGAFGSELLLRPGGSLAGDPDHDEIAATEDNCSLAPNQDQADADGDGVGDACDDCVLVPNPTEPVSDAAFQDASDVGLAQRDTDGDGYGNVCDPDLNGDGVVNFADLARMKAAFFGSDPDADLNGDGVVNFVDLAVMKAHFFGAPGPSAQHP